MSWTTPCTRRAAETPPPGAPWYLGQICGRWREVALGLPSLWSSIAFFHTLNHSHERAMPLRMLQAQLIRSAHAPLHVDFEWNHPAWDRMDAAAPFWDAILPQSDRWASLRLVCRDNSYHRLFELLSPARGRLSQLNALEIDSGWQGVDDSPALDTFSVAPNLQQIIVTNPSFDQFSPPFLFPWDRVTRYRGAGTVEYLLRGLRAASHLVEGALAFEDWFSPLPDGSIITLPQLRRLYIEQADFLAYFAAPQLEYLSCDEADKVLPFLARSSCHLTTLVLSEGSLTHRQPFALPPDDVISLLQHTPSLQNLVLQANTNEKQDNDRVLSALTVTGSAGELCPNLTFFAYGRGAVNKGTGTDAFSGDVFIAMIRSRIHPDRNCRLCSLRVLRGPMEIDAEELLEGIQTVSDEGLDDVKVLDDPSHFIEHARYLFNLSR
ncbi:hypothetical protein DFH06DRAFT_1230529 [Mycena polygramma]|nr:hypothetical protein DFH06DRAFT_1230529 [Mycena polygramma]